MEIHISDIRTFKQCRRKWNWSSPLRGNLERDEVYPPFLVGRAIHSALCSYYENGEAPNSFAERYIRSEATGLEPHEVEEQVALAAGMMEHYVLWVKADNKRETALCDNNLRPLALETDFNIPSGIKGVRYAGRFDGVVQKVDDGSYWLLEHKTTRSIRELLNSLLNDEQCVFYMNAAQRILKVPISGVIYNLMRKKVPILQFTSTGHLSQNKQNDVSLEWVLGYIRNAYDDPEELEEALKYYGEYLAFLGEKENTFFQRHAIYRTADEMQMAMTDMQSVVREMVSKRTKLYPSPSLLNCNWCTFRNPCLAMNRGADVQFILEHGYRERKVDEFDASETNSNTNI